MKKIIVVMLCILALGILQTRPVAAQSSGSGKLPEAPAAKTQSPTPSPFKDQKEKISYALGMKVGTDLGNNLKKQSVDIDPSVVAQGLKDGMSGAKTLMTDDEATAVLTQLQNEVQAKHAEKVKQEAEASQKDGDAFLAANKTKEGVTALPSGLQYKILTPGTGPKPTASDTVICNYRGTLINGTEFDSSYKRGQPATFPVSGVIKGWTEALQLMPVGSKWQLFIPPSLAYGERGAGNDIGPNSTLIFEVELISIKPKEDAPKGGATPK
ncbi:MAG TPA: FKBP-type peptidyl-prolyl cis-trans isomerase [Candidatus Angelobacter sp.]|nr:FKBP-type peptidyl-prolyl cis-trans isomerase [Candidatus Angelobacter sp.]